MSFEPLVASIDLGTTSTRAILFNKLGQEVAKHQVEYSTSAQVGSRKDSPQIISSEGIAITVSDDLQVEVSEEPTLNFPKAGWVECRVESILANAIQCFAACLISLEKINITRDVPYKVTSIGVANMRETTIVWSQKTGKALYNGIVWSDTRTSAIVKRINAQYPAEKLESLRQINGLPISTYFSATKFQWLLENVPEVKDAYENGNGDLMFGTLDTWLIYNITSSKAFVTDVTNASRTAYMNLETIDYDDELLKFWNIDRKKIQLPKILSSSEVYGHFALPDLTSLGYTDLGLSKEAAEKLESVKGLPICGCLGDQSASLVGQLAVRKGSAKCTYGTGAFLLYNTGDQKLISRHGAVTTFGYWFPELDEKVDGKNSSKPQFALEGSIAVAGSCVQWLRDNLRLISKAQDVGPLASEVDNSGGVVFVPAFSGLFAPYWDSESRGTILGLTQYTSASHIARAALEGVCFQTRAILKAMINDAGASADFLDESSKITGQTPLSILAVDGGMSKSDEVMQIQSDILGPCVTVRRSPNAECTALGAAIAAGICSGLWTSLDDAVTQISKGNKLLVTKKDGSQVDNDFHATLSDDQRRVAWVLWERAVEKAKGWLSGIETH
ncbi:hypothetical protein PACTADRAFT_50279 [Pachysolen tannophilus NRRL Y-2460]|uniref:glycerol kinase n=1 Tax=Pachysolen tannophilus NRRL Y-2460 TaxID=669874 RepID=A0A1E4TV22_PACTA|nr:hypothetical protein PACTADRAFT_50279 [Pachysolen tannophilus NRRL Y-2460]